MGGGLHRDVALSGPLHLNFGDMEANAHVHFNHHFVNKVLAGRETRSSNRQINTKQSQKHEPKQEMRQAKHTPEDKASKTTQRTPSCM